VITPGPDRARGALHAGAAGVLSLDVPQPGVHNLENAAAAALVALELGVPAQRSGPPCALSGVARRFQVIGATARGIRVVDDYAHNGERSGPRSPRRRRAPTG